MTVVLKKRKRKRNVKCGLRFVNYTYINVKTLLEFFFLRVTLLVLKVLFCCKIWSYVHEFYHTYSSVVYHFS